MTMSHMAKLQLKNDKIRTTLVLYTVANITNEY
jgi:hypothetical protein